MVGSSGSGAVTSSPATPEQLAGVNGAQPPATAASVKAPAATYKIGSPPVGVQVQGVTAITNWYANEQKRVAALNDPKNSLANTVKDQSTPPPKEVTLADILANLKNLSGAAGDGALVNLTTGGGAGSTAGTATGGASGNLQVIGLLLSAAGLAAYFLFRK